MEGGGETRMSREEKGGLDSQATQQKHDDHGETVCEIGVETPDNTDGER